ncbi:P-loop containing protein [Fusarium circinatum]|uniref:P-loop containing protein n=1 Tax=Fusarium circinatum TaxID=48490 RepID=A0A8H5X4E9_FUSCI|nr:P-loop containing protein [Fusarium circinatum]
MIGQALLKMHTRVCLSSGKSPVLSRGSSLRFLTTTNNLLQRQTKKSPFIPSRAQQEIAELCSTKNVVVSARPGSGKTATAEAIVAAHPDKRVVVLTYSKRLQLETYRRISTYSNCEVYTFHGMAGILFGMCVQDDAVLVEQRKEALDRREPPQWSPEPFDIIVLDEFQDCTELLFWLTNCFISANDQKAGGQSARLVVLGDERQAIYGFRGADDRYLSLAPELLGPVNSYPFVRAQLDESFRLSCQSVRFINNTFLGGETYITSSKTGPKPIVLRCHRWGSSALASQLSSLIKRKNTAILAPIVRKRSPMQRVVNLLCKKHKVPISVSAEDDVPLDNRVNKGKMCVSTIHQFKGSERDLVILFGLDSSFFEYLGRDVPDDSCPNETFVALSRAVEQLVLVHFEEAKLMPFTSVASLYETADVVNISRNQHMIESPEAPGQPLIQGLMLPRSVAVRDIARHIKDKDLNSIIDSHLCVKKLSPLPKDEHIRLPDVVVSDRGKNFHEAVSDLNGLAVVAAFEYDIAGTLSTLDLSQSGIDIIPEFSSQQGVSWLCRKACNYEANVSGYLPRSIQMESHAFNWIEPDDLALARSRLREELSESAANPSFEVRAEGVFSIDDQECVLGGRADIVAATSTSDGNNARGAESIWEIKFVQQLSNQHVIQACTYAYLLKLPCIVLYNVRTGEKWEITPRDGQERLHRMVEEVLRLKYTSIPKVTDDEFIENCAAARWEVSSIRC